MAKGNDSLDRRRLIARAEWEAQSAVVTGDL